MDKDKFLIFIILLFSNAVYAQDVEALINKTKNITKAKAFQYSGGFNIQTKYYNSWGGQNRKDPFAWAINANLNFMFWDKISMPFSINFTDKGQRYSAYNPWEKGSEFVKGIIKKTGFSPKYKAVTLHLGDRSMNFSTNTYSGVHFYGYGAEINPQKSILKFAFFNGLLSKKIEPDTINDLPIMPAYKRKSWGAKLDIGKKSQKLSLIAFHAKDDLSSFDSLPAIYGVTPKENMVFSVISQNKIAKKLNFKLELASSAITQDIRAPKREIESQFGYYNNLGEMFQTLLSTNYNTAVISDVKYAGNGWSLGANYQRVDPSYTTLGSFSIKNDFESYMLKAQLSLMKGKINLAANMGSERNNLAQNLSLDMRRFIYSGNFTWSILENLSFNGAYSNFNHSTSPSLINFADTVKLMQINQSQNYALSYNIPTETLNHAFNINAAIQETNDIQDFYDYEITNTNRVYNYMANYSLQVKSIASGFSVSGLYTQIESGDMSNQSVGFSISANKSSFKKALNTALSASYMNVSDNQANESNNFSIRINNNFKYKKHHTAGMNCSLLFKNSKTADVDNNLTELQINIKYAFVF